MGAQGPEELGALGAIRSRAAAVAAVRAFLPLLVAVEFSPRESTTSSAEFVRPRDKQRHCSIQGCFINAIMLCIFGLDVILFAHQSCSGLAPSVRCLGNPTSSSDGAMASTPALSEGTDGFFSCHSPHVWFNDAQTTVHPISPCVQVQARHSEPIALPPPPKPVQLTPT